MAGAVCFYKATFLRSFRSKLRTRITAPCAHKDHRLVGLMLSSRDHSGDRDWLAIGAGPWDSEGRSSWLRRDRLLAVPAASVRREGAVLPRATYDAVIAAIGVPPVAAPNRTGWTLRDGFRRILGRPHPRSSSDGTLGP